MPKKTISGLFELSISAGGVNDEDIPFQIEVTAEIEPLIPARPQTFYCPAEPEEGGHTTITDIEYFENTSANPPTHDASWLIDLLPSALIRRWEIKLYEEGRFDD